MASHNVQETLDRILADLRSDENTRQLAAIHELGTINYSSEAILHELEQLALGRKTRYKNSRSRHYRSKQTKILHQNFQNKQSFTAT